MIQFIIKRIIVLMPTLLLISIVSFIIIQLPPGDYLTSYIAQLSLSGSIPDESEVAALKARYGLDQPFYVQYFKWIFNLMRGDFGYSFEWNRPVNELIWSRLGLTLVVALASMAFSYIVAIPIGIYTAVRQHSPGDYVFTFLGFIGLATPNFMIALILMYVSYKYFGISIGGLFSPEFSEAPWTFAKLVDLMKHIWIPMVVVGTAGTAGLIRVMRNNLLDELKRPYVLTARAKGVRETVLVVRYAVRVAINPVISTVGWVLPQLISGATITAVVLSLPTTGPLLLRSLLNQDMFLAGSFTMLLAVLTVIGTLISDILLAAVDPRIRFD
jgi:peptide/nickel transport system permease protein